MRVHTLHPLFVFAFALALCAATSPPAAAQSDEPSRDLQVRATAFEHVNGITHLHLFNEDRHIGEIELSTTRLDRPLKVPARNLTYGIFKNDENEDLENFLPLGQVNLPAAGRDFILVFVPRGDGYHAFPIRVDDPSYRGNDSILFNFTRYPIAVILGQAGQQIEPMRHRRLRPRFDDDAHFYQATFFYEKDGETIPFNNTRWPVNPNVKALVFVFENPQNERLAYRAITILAD